MKRFFCTVCKKVKRVRKLPRATYFEEINPVDRIGKCNKHFIKKNEVKYA